LLKAKSVEKTLIFDQYKLSWPTASFLFKLTRLTINSGQYVRILLKKQAHEKLDQNCFVGCAIGNGC